MYTYIISRRTQITFTDRQHALLVYESNRCGLPMAELVRRAVDRTFRPVSRRPFIRGFELVLGLSHEPVAAKVFSNRSLPPIR